MFTIRYAVPVGGKREFSFATAAELAEHISVNRPAIMAVLPKWDENYYDKFEGLLARKFSMPHD